MFKVNFAENKCSPSARRQLDGAVNWRRAGGGGLVGKGWVVGQGGG